MRRILVAAGVALAILSGGGAPAAPFTTAFDNLRAELLLRKDNQFEKRQQKAILKSLALIDRPSPDLTHDLKTAASVGKALQAGFPEEFGPVLTVEPSFTPVNLLLLIEADTLPRLRDLEIQPALDGLQGQIPTLVPGSPAAPKASAAASAAAVALAAPFDSPADHAKLLLKAWKKVLLGRKLIQKGDYQRMAIDFAGQAVQANSLACGIYGADQGIVVFGYVNSFTFAGTGISGPAAVEVKILGVTGPGTFPIGATVGDGARAGAYVSSAFISPWILDPGSGTLVVTHFDPAGAWIAGSFEFTATGGPGGQFPATVEVSGTFTATTAVTVDSGSTPP